MVAGFQSFPLKPMLLALLIPLVYSLCKVRKKDRKELKPILLISLCSVGTVIFYGITYYLSNYLGAFGTLFGYSIGKFILFVLLPMATIFYIERWPAKKIFSELGVKKAGIEKSVLYGLLVAVVTIIITIFVSVRADFDLTYRTIMFFEAFTEEFFFRGFLFLYLAKKTNRKVAYATSILGFILIHPQHFISPFLISTITQGILMTIVADKTDNVVGPWIGHGLNRFVPPMIKMFFA